MNDYFNKKLNKLLKREEMTILADFGVDSPLLNFLGLTSTINPTQDKHPKYFKKKKPIISSRGKNGK